MFRIDILRAFNALGFVTRHAQCKVKFHPVHSLPVVANCMPLLQVINLTFLLLR